MKERTINWHQFLSTLSLRRATEKFVHPLAAALFLSTLSLRRATAGACHRAAAHAFLSTLSLRRATYQYVVLQVTLKISIHALLAESDGEIIVRGSTAAQISIHALLAESDCQRSARKRSYSKFLSTLSLRRATAQTAGRMGLRGISIHALLAESDFGARCGAACVADFYPRSPCGERLVPPGRPALGRYFYPRSPCGERPHGQGGQGSSGGFLSTLSLRRATPFI